MAGQSAVTLRNLILFLNGNAPITPVEQEYEVLNTERYQQICLPEEHDKKVGHCPFMDSVFSLTDKVKHGTEITPCLVLVTHRI